jgi:hypothetical protein
MPGPLLTFATQVQCVHAGVATATTPNPRVSVLGVPTVTMASPFVIAGCTFPAMTTGAPPCVTAQFTVAATRVTSTGQPLLLIDSQATCVPNGTPVIIVPGQVRVTAQ